MTFAVDGRLLAHIDGTPRELPLRLPAVPALGALFNATSQLLSAASGAPFVVHELLVLEGNGAWEELTDAAQLGPSAVVFAVGAPDVATDPATPGGLVRSVESVPVSPSMPRAVPAELGPRQRVRPSPAPVPVAVPPAIPPPPPQAPRAEPLLRDVALEIFDRLDTDSDGVVALDSIRSALTAAAMSASADSIGDRFARGYGTVTAPEFVTFIASVPVVGRRLLAAMRCPPPALPTTSSWTGTGPPSPAPVALPPLTASRSSVEPPLQAIPQRSLDATPAAALHRSSQLQALDDRELLLLRELEAVRKERLLLQGFAA